MDRRDREAIERELREASERLTDRKRAEALARESDRIVSMILSGEFEKVDIEIAARRLRRTVAEEVPGKAELFDMVYAGRFRRIWEQFGRGGELRI